MNTLILHKTEHRGEIRISLEFEKNQNLISILRLHFMDLRWSQTLNKWHLPYSSQLVHHLLKHLKGLYYVEYSALKRQENKEISPKITQAILAALDPEKALKIKQFRDYLRANRYSENTVKVYTDSMATFLRFHSDKILSEINNKDVEVFNNDYILKNQYSASFQNQVVNAIKLFFITVNQKIIVTELLERPRREHKLPNVLSKEEVKSIINAPINIKHKMMLSLIYACGLRCGELINLNLKDIHSDRNLLLVRQGKGKKDRIVPISDKLIQSLREYYLNYKPKTWLFEGQIIGEKYSAKSLQNVLKQSIHKVKITKPVTLHWLRHSYATHLLESGTDLRYIQELLGHGSSRTTEIYTHVSTKNIQNITSPFDTL